MASYPSLIIAYRMIDATPLGGIPWQSVNLSYDGPQPDNPPTWMTDEHTIQYRDQQLLFKNMLDNPDFANLINYAPYRQYDAKDGIHHYENLMSGDWSWKQAVS